MIAELLATAGQVAGQALGGPPPASTANGGVTSTGANNVTYNKGPDWRLIAGGALVLGLVWMWKRKK